MGCSPAPACVPHSVAAPMAPCHVTVAATCTSPGSGQETVMLMQRTHAFVAAAMLLAGGTQAANAAEAVPATLQPPAGYTLAFTAKAKGLQVYTSAAEAGAAPKWVLEAPVAELAAKQGAVHHYA